MPARDPETRRETWRRYYDRKMATKDGREVRAARERERRPSWLGKAVQEALVDAGLAGGGTESAQPADTGHPSTSIADASSANTQENE